MLLLNYWLLKFSVPTFGRIPKIPGYAAAATIGLLFYYVNARQRRAVKANLRHVLGRQASQGLLARKARAVFLNVGRNYYDLVRLPRAMPQKVAWDITVEHWERLENAIATGKGVILATAHLGSFDLVAQVAATRNISFTIMAEPLEPPQMHDLVARLRQSHGHRVAPVTAGGLRDIVTALRSGGTVAIACDRTFNGQGSPRQFMDKEALLPDGAVELATRTGAVIIPSYNVRLNGWGKFALYFEEPIYLSANGAGLSAKEASQRLTQLMEQWIKQWPEQWVVLSPVWPE